ELVSGLTLLRKLANNLETILLSNPQHEQKESIAFVAGTANSLIYKMGLISEKEESLLGINSISSYISSIVLFLIGNSQADAAEAAGTISETKGETLIQQRLIASVISLATGKLSKISESNFNESEISNEEDFELIALNYLWREIGLGILYMAKRLIGRSPDEKNLHFDKVIELSVSNTYFFKQ